MASPRRPVVLSATRRGDWADLEMVCFLWGTVQEVREQAAGAGVNQKALSFRMGGVWLLR